MSLLQAIPDLMENPAHPRSNLPSKQPHPHNLSTLSVPDLLALRTEVEQHLPAKALKDLDLARELVLQVLALQQMQLKAIQAEDTPVNQIAQAANSLSSALVSLVKLQESVYTSERLKRIETVLIETLRELPLGSQERFLAAYAEALEGLK